MPVRTRAARAFVPDGLELVSAAGRTAGGVLLARYGDGATLGYDELIVFAGAVRAGGRRGMWVSHIYVDLPASVAGGRRIWGLPKELAEFGWGPRAVSVHGLLEARISRAPVKAPVPLRPSTFGRRDGRFLGLHATADAYNTGLIRSATGLATSDDGLYWQWEGPILTPRDHGWDPLTAAGWEVVSVVSIDDTWSALRFRPRT